MILAVCMGATKSRRYGVTIWIISDDITQNINYGFLARGRSPARLVGSSKTAPQARRRENGIFALENHFTNA